MELIKTQRFKPALADFRNDQEGLSKYLADILSEAKQVVPEDEYSITPISVMATAGMWDLGFNANVIGFFLFQQLAVVIQIFLLLFCPFTPHPHRHHSITITVE